MTPSPIQFVASSPVGLPRLVPQQKWRPTKKNIPPTVELRQQYLRAVRNYVAEFNPVPPQPTEELKVHADRVIAQLGCDPIFRDFIGVLLNNEMWREQLAGVPFERRLLLLPKCLRVEAKCPAPFDEFGLLCKQCGLCSIQDLTVEAEKLGYAVLVAEGSAIVMSLIQTGKIEAIVGVSCLSVLERAFPYMEAAAIPGVAVPLLQDDCIDTNVDLDWVWEYIHLTADDKTRRLDLERLRDEVDWFTPAIARSHHGPRRGRDRGDRPRMADARRQTLAPVPHRRRLPGPQRPTGRPTPGRPPQDRPRRRVLPQGLAHPRRHRGQRRPTLRREDAARGTRRPRRPQCRRSAHRRRLPPHRRPASRIPDATKAAMLQVAADGQRELCRGQGAELVWTRQPGVLSPIQVVDIFRQKTAPAFEVALRLGALYSGRHDECDDVLGAYSRALGIAYQIRDDLADLGASGETDDIAGQRPSLLLAIARERASGESRAYLDQLWRREITPDSPRVEAMYRELKADERCEHLLESYKEEAIRSLATLEHPSLKGLLRRVVGKIFNDVEIKGWCKEQEQRNAQQRLDDIAPQATTASTATATEPTPVAASAAVA